jgi:hypothetical protein
MRYNYDSEKFNRDILTCFFITYGLFILNYIFFCIYFHPISSGDIIQYVIGGILLIVSFGSVQILLAAAMCDKIDKHLTKINRLEYIQRFRKIDREWLLENINNVDWYNVCKNKYLTVELVKEFAPYIKIEYLMHSDSKIKDKLIEVYKNYQDLV